MTGPPMRSRPLILASLALAVSLLPACGSGGADKAGAVRPQIVLRLATTDHGDYAKLFADEVRALSHGRIGIALTPGAPVRVRIGVTPGAPDYHPPDADLRVARTVLDGRYDLGFVGAQTWDELGVTSFEPLQAPLLITDQSLFKAVLDSPLTGRMLAGLRARNAVGLALVPGFLRHPFGYGQPLTTVADFRGKRIQVPLSRLNDAVISALGARPVHHGFEQLGSEFARVTGERPLEPLVLRHELGGEEQSVFGPQQGWITANVTFSADAATLFANEKSWSKLSAEQRRTVRTAAAVAARRALQRLTSRLPEAKGAVRYCGVGDVINASQADIAALAQALRPVYAQLERDPQVNAMIAAIREIKRRTPPDPPVKVPASCSPPVAATRGRVRNPSFLDGAYRWRLPKTHGVATVTLRGGRWSMQVSDGATDSGTFEVVGKRIVFGWPLTGNTFTFTFQRRANGTLDLRPVPPMSRPDRAVWAPAPWKRLGPPIEKIK